jgi:hypothetical protein
MTIRKITPNSTAPLIRHDAPPVAAPVPQLPAAGGKQGEDHASIERACPARQSVALNRDQIAERAQTIWLKRGCPRNRDVENWREAEAQLKVELGIA